MGEGALVDMLNVRRYRHLQFANHQTETSVGFYLKDNLAQMQAKRAKYLKALNLFWEILAA